jgi:F-box/leucine-rich repeat protein 14
MFEHIGYLNRLERLDLRTCERITGETGFSSLFTLKQLKYLNLRGCYGITDAGLAQLKEADLADVEVLNLQECWQITAAGLAHLSKMTALRDLNVSGCRNLVCAEGLPGIGALDQLTSLCLKNCERLGDGSLDSLTSLQQLVHLDISGCRELTGAGLAPLAQLNNNSLETLRMQHCIGLRGPNCLVHLAALNKLTVMHLGGCDNMVGTALRDLARSSRSTIGTDTGHRDRDKQQEGQYNGIALKSLNLEGCRNVPLLDRGVAALAGSGGAGQLTYLSLSGCTALTDAGLAVLGKLGALKQLNLSDCVQIDGTGFGSWVNLHPSGEKEENDSRCRLENLQLQGCIGISNQGLKAVAQLKLLRELNLKHCKHAGDDGLQALAASLSQLTSLSLQGMAGVTDKGIGHLSTMTSLRELELQFCWQFSEDALCQLTGCNQLSYLNLMYSWQGVTDATLETLVSGIPCLVSLNVLGCHRLSARAKTDAAHFLEWV